MYLLIGISEWRKQVTKECVSCYNTRDMYTLQSMIYLSGEITWDSFFFILSFDIFLFFFWNMDSLFNNKTVKIFQLNVFRTKYTYMK